MCVATCVAAEPRAFAHQCSLRVQSMPTSKKTTLPDLPTPRAVTTQRVGPHENFVFYDSRNRPQLLCRREEDQSILICFNYLGPHHMSLSRHRLEDEARRRR